jgi:glycosyltransferase involved in cell wall biosynthesis
MLKFSVVIPIYNEEESIRPLYFSLRNVMGKLGQSYEIIFVNDGSNDKTIEVLYSIDTESTNLVIVDLEKHSGKSQAMQSGFDTAQGELIITIDGDMQYDPNDIPRLLEKMREGNDAVCGWRYKRMDPWIKKISSKIAVTVRRLITGERLHDPACNLAIFKKEILRNVYLSNGMHRFLMLIVLKLGYTVAEVKVSHRPRRFGESKYNIRNRLFQGIVNLVDLSLFDIRQLIKRKLEHEIGEIINK